MNSLCLISRRQINQNFFTPIMSEMILVKPPKFIINFLSFIHLCHSIESYGVSEHGTYIFIECLGDLNLFKQNNPTITPLSIMNVRSKYNEFSDQLNAEGYGLKMSKKYINRKCAEVKMKLVQSYEQYYTVLPELKKSSDFAHNNHNCEIFFIRVPIIRNRNSWLAKNIGDVGIVLKGAVKRLFISLNSPVSSISSTCKIVNSQSTFRIIHTRFHEQYFNGNDRANGGKSDTYIINPELCFTINLDTLKKRLNEIYDGEHSKAEINIRTVLRNNEFIFLQKEIAQSTFSSTYDAGYLLGNTKTNNAVRLQYGLVEIDFTGISRGIYQKIELKEECSGDKKIHPQIKGANLFEKNEKLFSNPSNVSKYSEVNPNMTNNILQYMTIEKILPKTFDEECISFATSEKKNGNSRFFESNPSQGEFLPQKDEEYDTLEIIGKKYNSLRTIETNMTNETSQNKVESNHDTVYLAQRKNIDAIAENTYLFHEEFQNTRKVDAPISELFEKDPTPLSNPDSGIINIKQSYENTSIDIFNRVRDMIYISPSSTQKEELLNIENGFHCEFENPSDHSRKLSLQKRRDEVPFDNNDSIEKDVSGDKYSPNSLSIENDLEGSSLDLKQVHAKSLINISEQELIPSMNESLLEWIHQDNHILSQEKGGIYQNSDEVPFDPNDFIEPDGLCMTSSPNSFTIEKDFEGSLFGLNQDHTRSQKETSEHKPIPSVNGSLFKCSFPDHYTPSQERNGMECINNEDPLDNNDFTEIELLWDYFIFYSLNYRDYFDNPSFGVGQDHISLSIDISEHNLITCMNENLSECALKDHYILSEGKNSIDRFCGYQFDNRILEWEYEISIKNQTESDVSNEKQHTSSSSNELNNNSYQIKSFLEQNTSRKKIEERPELDRGIEGRLSNFYHFLKIAFIEDCDIA